MNSRLSILVVDDEPVNVKLLEAHLVPEGFEVISASDGEEALKKSSEHKVDLVLLDVMMPRLDGFETCKRLRENPRNHSLPIVMLTAKGKESDIVVALENGADDYVTKPFFKDDLMKKIRALLLKAEKEILPSQLYFKKLKPGQTDAQAEAK